MKKTMLTYKTLDRFEAENDVLGFYTNEQIEKIEYCAYVANMNRSAHPDWTDDDVYDDFLRVLAIEKIPVGYPPEEPTIKYPYLHEITIDGLTFGAEQVVWRVEKLTHERRCALDRVRTSRRSANGCLSMTPLHGTVSSGTLATGTSSGRFTPRSRTRTTAMTSSAMRFSEGRNTQ